MYVHRTKLVSIHTLLLNGYGNNFENKSLITISRYTHQVAKTRISSSYTNLCLCFIIVIQSCPQLLNSWIVTKTLKSSGERESVPCVIEYRNR